MMLIEVNENGRNCNMPPIVWDYELFIYHFVAEKQGGNFLILTI